MSDNLTSNTLLQRLRNCSKKCEQSKRRHVGEIQEMFELLGQLTTDSADEVERLQTELNEAEADARAANVRADQAAAEWMKVKSTAHEPSVPPCPYCGRTMPTDESVRTAQPPSVSPECAFELGWRTAANWAGRDDLHADIGSPAYLGDMRVSLERASVTKSEQLACTCPPGFCRGDAGDGCYCKRRPADHWDANGSPVPFGYELWRHMHEEHGLTLVQSEIDEIVRLAVGLHTPDYSWYGGKVNEEAVKTLVELRKQAVETNERRCDCDFPVPSLDQEYCVNCDGKRKTRSTRETSASPSKCLRDPKNDNNLQGPCSAGLCQWPNCTTVSESDG
jgi:hypothetical protein